MYVHVRTYVLYYAYLYAYLYADSLLVRPINESILSMLTT
jgi:hypothetical protein